MSDDYFGAGAGGGATPQPPQPPAQPAAYAPPAQPPPTYGAPPAGETGPSTAVVSMSGSVMAAWGGVFSSLLMCLGAWSSWLRVHGPGATLNYGGLHAHLSGKWVLLLGLVVLACSVALLAMQQGNARTYVAAGLAAAGLLSLVITIHQYVVLSDRADAINRVGSFVGLHVSSGWGLWQSSIGSAGAVAAGAVFYLLQGGPLPRSRK